jgi:hypothetical protein
MRSSSTIVVSPSEQIREGSPGAAGTVCTSTSTSGLRAERAGDDRALRMVLGLCVGELPLRRISSTSEWSRVSRRASPRSR